MSGFGNTLKSAREQKGLSVAQVSEMTRLSQDMISLLEQEDFSLVPAPLYGRGFVKLFCGAVGLDPKPLIEQFMQLYVDVDNRAHRAPATRESVAAKSQPDPAPAADESAPAAETPAPREIPVSRYAAPRPIDERPSIASAILGRLHAVPSHVWRLSALAIGAAILASLIFIGVRALYRATTAAPLDSETAESVEAEATAEDVPSAPAETAAAEPTEAAETTAAPVTVRPRRGTFNEPLYVD